MDINFLYNFTRHLIGKNQMPTYSPDSFFYLWNAEQRTMKSNLLGQLPINKRAGISSGLVDSERVLGALRPFTKKTSISVTSGVGSFPGDCEYVLAMRCGDARVHYVNKGQWYSVKKSVIDPPSTSANKYYYTDYAAALSALPAVNLSFDIDYIGSCVDVKWAYDIDPTTKLPIYNAGNSVQPQWADLEMIEITKRTLKSIGVRFSSQDFENFGQSAINTGN